MHGNGNGNGNGNGHKQGLDRAALVERFDGDAELLRDIAGAFLAHCPELMTEIGAAAAARDARRLRDAAHSLKGSAAVDAAFRLERMGIDGCLDEADAVFAELQARIRDLEVDLGALVVG
jgi:HPt (histidine-containing phosphotransfer) domain-containing protein